MYSPAKSTLCWEFQTPPTRKAHSVLEEEEEEEDSQLTFGMRQYK